MLFIEIKLLNCMVALFYQLVDVFLIILMISDSRCLLPFAHPSGGYPQCHFFPKNLYGIIVLENFHGANPGSR